jgi:hypothetical protein
VGNLRDGGETVPDDGMSCYFEEGLLFTLAGVCEVGFEKGVTFGRSRDNGLNRVPLDGPPTYIPVNLPLLPKPHPNSRELPPLLRQMSRSLSPCGGLEETCWFSDCKAGVLRYS